MLAMETPALGGRGREQRRVIYLTLMQRNQVLQFWCSELPGCSPMGLPLAIVQIWYQGKNPLGESFRQKHGSRSLQSLSLFLY